MYLYFPVNQGFSKPVFDRQNRVGFVFITIYPLGNSYSRLYCFHNRKSDFERLSLD